jgi:hypothetical protein
MFPENPEINEMINLLKANQEDMAGQTYNKSTIQGNSKMMASTGGATATRKWASKNESTMPKIEHKVVHKPVEQKGMFNALIF